MNYTEIIIDEGYSGFNPVQFGYENCTPTHSCGPAVRDYWLLHYVISGNGTFSREGNTYNVSAGMVFVIPPFVETLYKADPKNPWQYVWIAFKTTEKLPDALNSAVIEIPELAAVFNDMRRSKNMISGKSAFLSSRIWEIMSIILESGKNGEPDYIEKAINCINSEYMNNITVSNLAERFNLDRCYFSTLFTKKVGMSPSQYIINLRLEKAAELMSKHGMSPSIAAASVGYTDICSFSKSFKKKYGLPPRQYKTYHTHTVTQQK